VCRYRVHARIASSVCNHGIFQIVVIFIRITRYEDFVNHPEFLMTTKSNVSKIGSVSIFR
jgi:hypothetical protein